MSIDTRLRKPDWLKIRLNSGANYQQVKAIVEEYNLHTVCQEARCPNQCECWQRRAATFLILGDICTRNCRFCAVNSAQPQPLDPQEPLRVAEAVKLMGLKYCVITSVTRDDLDDGGADLWAETIKTVRRINPDCKVEVLIPDFKGNYDALERIAEAQPDVIGHNLETVKFIYKLVRPQADYTRSLNVLRWMAEKGFVTKSGIMVGLGETNQQVFELMRDVYQAGCMIFTVGQYLQPTKQHLPVQRYVHPDEFKLFEEVAFQIGFKSVMSGPLVRSSYLAEQALVDSNNQP